MDDLTRREVLRQTTGASLLAALNSRPVAAADDPAPKPQTDRDCVLGAGLTEAEADCWEAVAKAAGLFFELPEMHPMDKQEVASAIHILQNKLLTRPTYRRYLELTKARPK